MKTIMNKCIVRREVELLELESYGLFNANPLYYYGTSICPLLFNGMFDASDYLEEMSKHFGWIDYIFDGNETIKEQDLQMIKVILTEEDSPAIVYLFLNCYHSFSLPIVPLFMYDVMEDVRKDAK